MTANAMNPGLPDSIINDFYVSPDTEIIILSGVPLDNTYEHTIFWHNLPINRSTQTNYFLSKARHRVLKQSYQRVDREWLKIYVPFDALYDCNYLMFRNSAFNPNKWWYAFILDVEYINDQTSKIRYEVDVMQTWLEGQYFDYQSAQCFVERCHSASDYLYENLIPESVVTADEYVVDEIKEFNMNNLSVIALVTEEYDGNDLLGNPTFKAVNGSMKYGTFGAVAVKEFYVVNSAGRVNNTELRRLKDFLSQYIEGGKENSVVSLQMFPTEFLQQTYLVSGNPENNPVIPDNPTFSRQLTPPAAGQTLGGANSTFVPKNKKLYSYPFNMIRINNECGCIKEFKWELFDKTSRGLFNIVGSEVWSPTVVIYPEKYKGINKNMEDSIAFNAFPVCPWSSDAYRAWWAQNAADVGTTALGGVASVVAGIAGAVTQNPMLLATGVGGAISSATKIGTSLYEGYHRPAAMHGDTNTTLALPAIENVKFVLTKESLRPEMLKIYDEYFTRYGYAQKRIMKPPVHNRRKWTYVQTVGYEFTGKINDRDSKKIKAIFDNGITFWTNPNEIGNYNLSNGLFNEPDPGDV